MEWAKPADISKHWHQTAPDKFTAVMSISSDRVSLFLANLANSIFTHNTQFSSETLVFSLIYYVQAFFYCMLDLWFA